MLDPSHFLFYQALKGRLGMKTCSDAASARTRGAAFGVATALALTCGLAGAAGAAAATPTPSSPTCSVASVTVSQSYCDWATDPAPDGAANPEPYGQCTYWAVDKRPDIQTASDAYGDTPAVEAQGDGAWGMEAAAQEAGYSIDHSPAVGDIAAFSPNFPAYTDGAGETWPQGDPGGHVAYVEQVNADGSVVISEMNVGSSVGAIEDLPASVAAEGFLSMELRRFRRPRQSPRRRAR
jgi:surface antigen